MTSRTAYQVLLPAGLILALGLALRFHHVDFPFVTWQDTGFVVGFAKAMGAAGMERVGFLPLRWYDVHTGAYTYFVNHPPLTHLSFAVLFDLFGPREWAYRSFNLIVGGVLGGVFLCRLAFERLGRNTALGALLLWAAAPSTAYFERMFSMSMEALSFMIVLTFYFFREDGAPKGWNRAWLFLAAVIGPLFDWHFSFIYVPLGIYALVDRRKLTVLTAAGAVSAAVTVAYMIYSAGVVAGASSLAGFFDAALIRWRSYIAGKVEVDRSIFDLSSYLDVLGRRFVLHFTRLGAFLVVLWAALVAWRGWRRGLTRWDIVLPAILACPGMIYLALVPHNTIGHIWTLYFFWPVMALMFGAVFAAAIELPPRALGMGAASALGIILIGWSLPILSALHGLSSYHLANSRTGQMLDLQRETIRSYAVENQDTVMFYTNVASMEFPGRKALGPWLEARRARNQPLPDAIVFNQGYRRLGPADRAAREAAADEAATRELAPFGYRAAGFRPAPMWLRVPQDRLFLVMDQARLPAEASGEHAPRLATFFSRGRVLRGVYNAHGGPGPVETRLAGFTVPGGADALKMSLLLRGRDAGVRYDVELAAEDGTRIVHSGRIGGAGIRHVEIPAARLRGKAATLLLRSELIEGRGPTYFYVAEPRLQSAALDVEKSLEVKPGAVIYRDERFTDPEQRLGFEWVREFWLGIVEGEFR